MPCNRLVKLIWRLKGESFLTAPVIKSKKKGGQMNKWMKAMGLVVCAGYLSGCATIISGSTQKVNVTSNPSGAMAKVDGNLAALTPTVFTLERKQDHTVEVSKEGYRTATVILRHTMNGATAGNILAGGVIGIGVDAMSGAMYKLIPDRIDVNLEAQSAPAPAVSPMAESPAQPVKEISAEDKKDVSNVFNSATGQ